MKTKRVPNWVKTVIAHIKPNADIAELSFAEDMLHRLEAKKCVTVRWKKNEKKRCVLFRKPSGAVVVRIFK